jgi:hypothetical protein
MLAAGLRWVALHKSVALLLRPTIDTVRVSSYESKKRYVYTEVRPKLSRKQAT